MSCSSPKIAGLVQSLNDMSDLMVKQREAFEKLAQEAESLHKKLIELEEYEWMYKGLNK